MAEKRIRFLLVAFMVASILFIILDDPEVDGPADSIVAVHVDDGEMNDAMRRARATVGVLIDRMPALQASGASVSVKFPLTENGKTEHVWMGTPRVEGPNFTGFLSSVPNGLPSWSQGDRVTVPIAAISDWMALADNTLYGGFTVHVLHGRGTQGDRQALTDTLGIVFPEEPVLWE